jgi:hypothetical protein
MGDFRLRVALGAIAGLLVLSVAGCGDSSGRYTPAEGAAREALDAALTAWKNGQHKPGAIPDSKPAVQVVDGHWQAGERLQAFEVVSEEPSTGGGRLFVVNLTMQAPAESKTVRYQVVGVEPLWVMREDDFKVSAGM